MKIRFNDVESTNLVMKFLLGKVKKRMQKQFPDAVHLLPNLVHEFQNNPTGPLGTVTCSPWSYRGNTLLIGDAAHAT